MSTETAENSQTAQGRETIIVRNVKKFFGPTRALDGVNFTARAGEIHAVVGGNGCGKSTMAKVVSGILPVDGGTVSILGETPSTPAESKAIGISTVYQEVLVADESTVVDNIFMGSDALFTKSMSQEHKVTRAAELMQELAGEPVDPFAIAGTLPLGLKQWITIARALVSDPRILILDESSAALDFDSTERLFAKMRSLRDQGATILIVTHRIAELIRISDRATVLRDGRDVGVLEKEQITEKNLLALMTGDENAGKEHSHEAPQPRDSSLAMRGEKVTLWPNTEPFDFEIRRGEILGIAGLDGQGQDAFVRAVAGVEPARSGSIQVTDRHGEYHSIRNLADALKGKISYVSGDRKREGIFASMSIFENMVMPLYREKKRGGILSIIDWPTLGTIFKREADNLLIKFGMREDRITSLSGGNQQKVLIGRGFAMRPDIIVLNDPARGIDVGAKTELYKHLRTFAGEGRSVVYMSSELEEFMGFATRVIVFRDGKPFDAFDGRTLDPKRVLEAMFGQTDGSGLESPWGLKPVAGTVTTSDEPRRVSATTDVVKIAVDVPKEIREAMERRNRAAALAPAAVREKTERSVSAVRKESRPAVPVMPKSIRIVEFDREMGEAREIGQGRGGR
ncbi:MAG: sugar ABC transporter ATP-binding protein [Hoeflea sp.]|nr:sugar ABC transporter ATP-binding protein [Rhodobiaceae bacterium]MCC0037126.1 sugar ABC transporter ATP-binding protein [Hoeflea sp.]